MIRVIVRHEISGIRLIMFFWTERSYSWPVVTAWQQHTEKQMYMSLQQLKRDDRHLPSPGGTSGVEGSIFIVRRTTGRPDPYRTSSADSDRRTAGRHMPVPPGRRTLGLPGRRTPGPPGRRTPPAGRMPPARRTPPADRTPLHCTPCCSLQRPARTCCPAGHSPVLLAAGRRPDSRCCLGRPYLQALAALGLPPRPQARRRKAGWARRQSYLMRVWIVKRFFG
eukprot:scaffold64452_cov66-Phaeocystis_antarctica.AAC.2